MYSQFAQQFQFPTAAVPTHNMPMLIQVPVPAAHQLPAPAGKQMQMSSIKMMSNDFVPPSACISPMQAMNNNSTSLNSSSDMGCSSGSSSGNSDSGSKKSGSSSKKRKTKVVYYRHDPYRMDGFCATAAPNPMTLSSSVATSQSATPPLPSFASFAYPHLASQLLHTELAANPVCSFIPFPSCAEMDADTAAVERLAASAVISKHKYPVKALLGQLPLNGVEVSPLKLAWVFRKFGDADLRMSVQPTCKLPTVEEMVGSADGGRKRQKNFRIVFFNTEEEMQQVQARIHKRILIDRCGVWFAKDDAEMAALQEYLGGDLKPVHAPKNCATLEPIVDSPKYQQRAAFPKTVMSFSA